MKRGMLDESQLQQVFVNLLLNAAHAIDRKGAIRIRTRLDPAREQVLVDVEDTGCGIAAEDLSRVFEPFFSTKKNGSGLGLAVSYGIIASHQGMMTVESTPGKGTCFTIKLPLVAADAESGHRGR
jgi:signal transduction histidine kinase